MTTWHVAFQGIGKGESWRCWKRENSLEGYWGRDRGCLGGGGGAVEEGGGGWVVTRSRIH